MNTLFQFKAGGTHSYYRSSKDYSDLRALWLGSQMSRKLLNFHFLTVQIHFNFFYT